MEATPADEDDRDRWADRRDDEADARDADADQRERHMDARERVLDRWEAEIAARAAALNMLDEDDETERERAAGRRALALERRRAESEGRRDAAIEREIRRGERSSRRDDSGGGDGFEVDSTHFTQLAGALASNPPLPEVFELVLAAGVAIVPGCGAVSLALTADGRLQTAASSAPWAADLDAVQLEYGCGPLPAAAAAAGVVTTPDLNAEACWPPAARIADRDAARSVVSFGLDLGSSPPGVLTLYSEPQARFDPTALRIGDVLAAYCATALARTLERLTYEAQAEAWQRALASRDLIGQAKGMLMEQRSVDAEAAFTLLRLTSQRLNVKLRDVAEHLVQHGRLPES